MAGAFKQVHSVLQFQWWFKISWAWDAILTLLWLLEPLVSTWKSFKYFKCYMATNYMATHAKHLNTKFADEPCSSNCSWSQQEYGCLDASKSRQIVHFSQGLKSFLLWPGTIILSLLQILIEKGFLISRRIFTNKF